MQISVSSFPGRDRGPEPSESGSGGGLFLTGRPRGGASGARGLSLAPLGRPGGRASGNIDREQSDLFLREFHGPERVEERTRRRDVFVEWLVRFLGEDSE
jgi:hypothetical protein